MACAALLTAGIALSAAGTANAYDMGTVYRSGSDLVFVPASSATPATVYFTSSSRVYSGGVNTLTAGQGCSRDFSGQNIQCSSGATRLVAYGSNVGDVLKNATYPAVRSVFFGGGGNDTLIGSSGADDLYGDAGNDTITGGEGRDWMIGGADSDLVKYDDRPSYVPVTVILDGSANDGAAGEGDFVQSENVYGGSGNDRLTGDGAANVLYGGDGNDAITGLGGTDYHAGGTGNDTISARNGDNDIVDCNQGTDLAYLDRSPLDANPSGCETALRG
ncbi:MAG: hypothetical protein JHC95_00810 [Solirubrobacteraceae bacterium]|nr:hypothetical protein [Solirubrobacteraceae bacterium]